MMAPPCPGDSAPHRADPCSELHCPTMGCCFNMPPGINSLRVHHSALNPNAAAVSLQTTRGVGCVCRPPPPFPAQVFTARTLPLMCLLRPHHHQGLQPQPCVWHWRTARAFSNPPTAPLVTLEAAFTSTHNDTRTHPNSQPHTRLRNTTHSRPPAHKQYHRRARTHTGTQRRATHSINNDNNNHKHLNTNTRHITPTRAHAQ